MRVRLLELVEQDDGERVARAPARSAAPPPAVDVRVAEQALEAVRRLVLAHVEPHEPDAGAEENSASAFASSVLPVPVGPTKRKTPSGRRRVGETGLDERDAVDEARRPPPAGRAPAPRRTRARRRGRAAASGRARRAAARRAVGQGRDHVGRPSRAPPILLDPLHESPAEAAGRFPAPRRRGRKCVREVERLAQGRRRRPRARGRPPSRALLRSRPAGSSARA